MTTAKKVIHWHGQGGDELAREFDDVPEGRYVLTAANDLGDTEDDTVDTPEDLGLTPEQIEGLREGLARFERGEPGIPLEEARARIRAQLEATTHPK
jgi:hypothetical protein